MADRAKLRGLWLTDKPLTALETAAAIADGSVFLDRALQRHVSFTRVYRAHCRNLGARGSARAGELLVAAADRADSAAERRAVALMRAAGITGWVLGHRFGTYVIDIAFPEARLAIEIDGWAWHMGVDRFRADRHPGSGALGPVAVHLARPDQPARLRHRRDPGGPGRNHGGRLIAVRSTDATRLSVFVDAAPIIAAA